MGTKNEGYGSRKMSSIRSPGAKLNSFVVFIPIHCHGIIIPKLKLSGENTCVVLYFISKLCLNLLMI